MTIGERIKKIRQEKGLSQKELGEKLNVSQQMIGQWETGKSNPKLANLQKIATTLSVSTNTFLKLEKNHTNDELMQLIKLHEEQQAELNKDNDTRHHLLTFHYDSMGKIGRDSLMEILANLKVLNNIGQQEASKRVEELTEIPRYTKPDAPPQD